MSSTWHLRNVLLATGIAVLVVVAHVAIVDGQTSQDGRPWYESLPAVAMDYKVHLDAGKEDCYYQYVQPGASLYVSFQVIEAISLSNFGIFW